MTRGRIIFYSIFGAYHLIAFIFTVVVESSASTLFKLVGYLSWFKYITFIGVGMIAADFIWLWLDQRKQKKNEEAWRLENNTLKAKVYDFQQEKKADPAKPVSGN